MFRSLAKTCAATAYTWIGAERFFRRPESAVLPFIAGYHRVVRDFQESARHTIPSMLISASTFEKHVDALARNFSLVSLDEIGSHIESNKPFRRPAAAMTFDDGYADVYHNAFPILKRKGIPAAVFVVTGLIGTGKMQVHDRLYRYFASAASRGLKPRGRQQPVTSPTSLWASAHGRPDAFAARTVAEEPIPVRIANVLTRFPQETILAELERFEAEHPLRRQPLDEFSSLTWKMIEEMQSAGITIGSHTDSHVLLTSETSTVVRSQLIESRRILEERLNRPVRHIAYPDGRWNAAVLEAAGKAGYRFGYTICPTRHSTFPLLTIPRKVLWERACNHAFGRFSRSMMHCHANGIFEANRPCEHAH